jgi:hypothetical protein
MQTGEVVQDLAAQVAGAFPGRIITLEGTTPLRELESWLKSIAAPSKGLKGPQEI